MKNILLSNNNHLYFDEYSKKQDIIFIHGYISDGRVWVKIKDIWDGNERLIFPTLEGFYNEEEKNNKDYFNSKNHLKSLIELIEKYCDGSVNLVGWSYGASLALMLAAKRPDLVNSLFLYEPGINSFIENEEMIEKIQLDRMRMAGRAIQHLHKNNLELAVRCIVDDACSKQNIFDNLSADVKKLFLDNSFTVPFMFGENKVPNLALNTDEVKNINCLVTICYGEYARPAYKIVSEELTNLLVNHNLRIIPDAYHIAPIYSPDKFKLSIKEHLDKVRSLCYAR